MAAEVSNDTLQLRFVDSTEAGTDADKAHHARYTIAFYTSAPFVRDATIAGSWHRAQSCEEMLAAFEDAGLAESHRGWLQGNFFEDGTGPTEGNACENAHGPLEHSHFFTDTGEFGSHDENGNQVDNGDYELVDSNALAFPSHAAEFGYDGELTVDFAIDGEVVTFDVVLPDDCDGSCTDAYAWALSAFASGSWMRGEVPN